MDEEGEEKRWIGWIGGQEGIDGVMLRIYCPLSQRREDRNAVSKCSTLDVAAPHASMTTVLQQWSIFFLLLAARGLKMPRPDRWTLAGGYSSKSAASIKMTESAKRCLGLCRFISTLQ